MISSILTISILSFVGVFSILVFFHELGHFSVARYYNVKIDRFSIGGGETLRGYEDHEFTGEDFFYGNFEIRRTLGKTFGLTLFYDYGDAWGLDGRTSFEGKGAYGVGLRLNTPMGPFRLDFAKATDRDSRFHFGIGQQF